MKEKNWNMIQGGLLAIAIVFLLFGVAAATPAIAHQFYGTVSNNLGPAPAGSTIIAKINDNVRGSITVTTPGVFGGPDDWDDKLVVTADSSEIGQTIVFWVNGYQATPTAVYQEGGKSAIALTYTVPVPTTTPTTGTPTPTPTPTIMPTPTPTPTPSINKVPAGGDVFIGEEGLDITAGLGSAAQIAYWAPGTSTADQPSSILTVGTPTNFYVSPQTFVGKTGPWYQWTGTKGPVAFNVVDPQISVKIWDNNGNKDVSGQTIPAGDYLNFRIETNAFTVTQQRPNAALEGFLTIKVRAPDGTDYTYLYQDSTQTIPLTVIAPNDSAYYWVPVNPTRGWFTDARTQSGTWIYKTGTYVVSAELNLNKMKENYKAPDGTTYTGKTVSPTMTCTLGGFDTLKIWPSPATIIRGNTYMSIIEGRDTYYLLSVRDCSGMMTGIPCDQPPMIVHPQSGVILDSTGYYRNTTVECSGCLKNVYDTVPHYPDNGLYYYAIIGYKDLPTTIINNKTYHYVGWETSVDTKPGTYTIAIQEWKPYFDPNTPHAETTVTVTKGVVTFDTYVYGKPASSGYMGETVKIKGTNTDSDVVYLFIKGPCTDCAGANMDGKGPVIKDHPLTFTTVSVRSDNTWEYNWYTKNLTIDTGDYTIYASSRPDDWQALESAQCHECSPAGTSCAAWTKKPFTLNKPTITGDIAPKTVKIVCCDPVSIVVSGTATGIMADTAEEFYSPVPIAYWVFGENKVAGKKYIFNTKEVKCPDATFSIDLKDDINTLMLEPGTYWVVLQHPMFNHRLDIIPDKKINWWNSIYKCNQTGDCGLYSYDTMREFVVSAVPFRWSKLFTIDGPDRLIGWQSISPYLIAGFENPAIDDTYKILTFKVESNTALQADFSGTPTYGAAPLSVQFTDISTGSPRSWEWNFGDGYTSNEENPLHVYESPGTYAVTLTITGLSGTSSTTKNNYITVTPGPTYTGTPTPTPTTPPANTMRLYPGWNFVSTPKALADGHNTVGTVFIGVVDTGGRSIFLYDAGSMSWQQMTAESMIRPLDGIWIYSTGTVDVPLAYKNDPLATPPTKDLATGWNAIGFSDVSPASARDTLTSVRNQWTQVIGFNAGAQAYDTSLINGGSGGHSDTNPMYPFKGYWLFMNSPGTLAAISA